METKHLWMIRAGFKNALASQVVQKKAIAVGWHKIGDVSELRNYNEFQEMYGRAYPNDGINRTKIMVGQIYKFAREIVVGDYVVTYVEPSKMFHLGQVQSNYIYNPDTFSELYPHVRNVQWVKHFLKSDLTSSALGSVGSILTVFRLDKHFDEILALKK